MMPKLSATLALVAILGGGFAALAPLASAQHEEEGAHAEEGAEHHPEVNWTGWGPDEHGNPRPPAMLGMFLGFTGWFLIVYFGARKPLAAFLVSRRKAIVDGLEEARRVEAAANAKHAEYTARIDNLDEEIARLRADFQRAGMEERDRMVAAAADRAHKLHAEAHFLVQQQLKTLREELTREAIEAAVSAADKILRERSTAADQQRLADEYLARLRASVQRGTAKSAPPARAADEGAPS